MRQEPGAGSSGSDSEASGSTLKANGAKLAAASPSVRGVLYEPDLELRKLVGRFIENRLQRQLAEGNARLATLGKAVPGRNGAAVLRDRLRQLQNWHSKARALLPVAKTFLKLA